MCVCVCIVVLFLHFILHNVDRYILYFVLFYL